MNDSSCPRLRRCALHTHLPKNDQLHGRTGMTAHREDRRDAASQSNSDDGCRCRSGCTDQVSRWHPPTSQTPPNPSMETQPLRFKALASLRSQALELRTSCCRSGPPWKIRQWTRGLLSSNPQAVGCPFSFMQGTRPQKRRFQRPPVRHESWRRSG